VHENPPDGHKPSLSIGLTKDGQVLIHCFAGCSAEEVLKALGLDWKDLRPNSWRDWQPTPKTAHPPSLTVSASGAGGQRDGNGQPPRRFYPSAEIALEVYGRLQKLGKPDHIYMYHQANGDPCFAVGRWDAVPGVREKTFCQTTKTTDGWALGCLLDKLPLYNLPSITQANPDVPVVICEGEKAAKTSQQCGLLTTTSAGGASAAPKTDWTPLAGRRVIVLPDHDEPGQKYAETVAGLALEAGAVEVKIFRLADYCPALPAGGDLADVVSDPGWCGCGLREGARLEDLGQWILEQAEKIPPWQLKTESAPGPVIVRLAEVEPQEVQWLWPGRIPLGRISLLVGMPGCGKSLLTLDMAARITRGWNWPDKAPCPLGNVLFVIGEDGLGDTVRGRAEAAGADTHRLFVLTAIQRMEKDQTFQVPVCLSHIEEITQAVIKTEPRLVVFDPIGHFIPVDIDTNTENHVRLVLGRLADLAEQYQAAILLVAHRRKAKVDLADDVVLGSRAFVGLSRAVWHVCKDAEDENRRLLVPGKNNLAPPMDGLAFWIRGDLGSQPYLEWEADPVPMTASQALAREYEAVRGGSIEEAKKALILALSDGPRSEKDLMATLQDRGFSEKTIRRAKKALGVESRKRSFTDGWEWSLPERGGYPELET